MRAISMWQPWASLFVAGPKLHETRTWETLHRGWLLVHAAKRQPTVAEIKAFDTALEGAMLRGMPRGALIGAVYIEWCRRCDDELRSSLSRADALCGDFSNGRFAWRRSDTRAFANPIPYVGRQRFFEVPTSVLASNISDESLTALGIPIP